MSDEARRPHPAPIFIVGAMGSGTTLLRLILDSHDRIAIAQETGFVRAIIANQHIPFWKFGGVWYQRLGWTESELDEQLAEFYGHLFDRLAEREGKVRWGDKTPFHVWHMRTLARVWPQARIIGTVRHPGAVANSVHNRFNWPWRKSVSHWVRWNMQMLHEAKSLPDRVAFCRYEDLVQNPEPLLRELLSWLDEPWSDRVLEHNRVHGERGTPTQVEGFTRSTDPLDPQRIGKWTATTDAKAWGLLRSQAAPLASYFGYTIDDPLRLAPFTEPGSERSYLLTGAEAAARRDSHPDVDWSFRPRRELANRKLTQKALKEELARAQASAPVPAVAADGDLARRMLQRLPPPVRRRVRAAGRRLRSRS